MAQTCVAQLCQSGKFMREKLYRSNLCNFVKIISLLLSICRRKDLINRRKYNTLDEDDVHSYYVEMGGDSFDATNGNSLNRKLFLDEFSQYLTRNFWVENQNLIIFIHFAKV